MFRKKLYLCGGILSWAHEDMINQKAISARIHVQTLWDMEQIIMTRLTNRNKMLNDGARMLIALYRARDAWREHEDLETREKILQGFLKQWFPEAAKW